MQALGDAVTGRIRMLLSDDNSIVIHRGGINFVLQAGQAGINRVLYAWPPDFREMNAWSRLIRPKDIFVDVGANAGLYSLWASHLGATAYAYEPSSDVWDLLQRNISANRWNIQSERIAIGESDGTVLISRGLGPTNRMLAEPCDGTATLRTETVAARSLDSLFPSQHLRGVKVDVEGFESQVLGGMEDILGDARVDCIQLEWNLASEDALGETRDVCRDALAEADYILCRPDPSGTLRPASDTSASDIDIFALSPRVTPELLVL